MPTIPDNHFLDANILIGCSATYDALNEILNGYFRRDYIFHTSNTAQDEAEGVLRGRKNVALQKLDKIFNMFPARQASVEELDEVYERLGYGQYAGRNSDLSDDYLEVYKSELVDQINSENRRKAINDASKRFQQARANLSNNLQRDNFHLSNCSGIDHKSLSKDQFDDLMDIIDYEPDVIIALDCSEISEELGETVLLATHDKGDFLGHKSSIEEKLPKVKVRTPASFL